MSDNIESHCVIHTCPDGEEYVVLIMSPIVASVIFELVGSIIGGGEVRKITDTVWGTFDSVPSLSREEGCFSGEARCDSNWVCGEKNK